MQIREGWETWRASCAVSFFKDCFTFHCWRLHTQTFNTSNQFQYSFRQRLLNFRGLWGIRCWDVGDCIWIPVLSCVIHFNSGCSLGTYCGAQDPFAGFCVMIIYTFLDFTCCDYLQGNWMHLKFASRMQARKALARNGRMLTDTLMIGVIPCTDSVSRALSFVADWISSYFS